MKEMRNLLVVRCLCSPPVCRLLWWFFEHLHVSEFITLSALNMCSSLCVNYITVMIFKNSKTLHLPPPPFPPLFSPLIPTLLRLYALGWDTHSPRTPSSGVLALSVGGCEAQREKTIIVSQHLWVRWRDFSSYLLTVIGMHCFTPWLLY